MTSPFADAEDVIQAVAVAMVERMGDYDESRPLLPLKSGVHQRRHNQQTSGKPNGAVMISARAAFARNFAMIASRLALTWRCVTALVMVVLTCLVSAAPLEAGTITYEFTSGSQALTISDPSVVSSSINVGGGLNDVGVAGGTDDFYAINEADDADLAASVASNAYLEYTISNDLPGNTLDVDGFSFIERNFSGHEKDYAVRFSTDGFSTFTVLEPGATADSGTWSGDGDTISYLTTDTAFDDITSGAFRIYYYNQADNNWGGTDDVTISYASAVKVFEGFEAGTTPSSPSVVGRTPDIDTIGGVDWSYAGSGTASGEIVVGSGTNTTKVMEFTNDAGGDSFSLGELGGMTSGQASFDVRWITPIGNEGFSVGLDAADSLNSSDRLRLFVELSQTGLSVDEWGTMTLVFNATGSEVIYADGAQSVANDTADLWVGDLLLFDDFARNDGTGGWDFFGFRMFGGQDGQVVQFDNIEIRSDIVFFPVPEPSGISLIAGFAIVGLVLFRRRMR